MSHALDLALARIDEAKKELRGEGRAHRRTT